MSLAQIGNKKNLDNHHSTETKKKISKGNIGKIASKETRRKLSIVAVERTMKYGVYGGRKYYRGIHSSIKSGEIRYNSSYEFRAYKVLDKLDDIQSYGACKTYILYIWGDGTEHRYTPDIHIVYTDGHEEIVEVKPKKLLKIPKNIAKFKAANKFYKDSPIKYSVWTETKLEKLEGAT